MKSLTKKEAGIFSGIVESVGTHDLSTSRSTKIVEIPKSDDIFDAYEKFKEYIQTGGLEDKVINPRRIDKILDIYKENTRINTDSVKERLMAARELVFLGIPIKYCEVDIYENHRKSHNVLDIKKEMPRRKFKTVAILNRVTLKQDRHGRQMAFVTMTDKTYALDGIIFSEAFDRNRDCIKQGEVAYIEGSISQDGSPIIDLVEKI